MDQSEAAELLALMVPFDQRSIDETDAIAWAASLSDVPFDATCREAIGLYYRTPPVQGERRDRMGPHHLRLYRSRIRNDRLERVPEPHMPNEVAGVDPQQELLAVRRAIGDGRIKSARDVEAYVQWGGSLYLADQKQLTSAGRKAIE
jgi:hypothetical protein